MLQLQNIDTALLPPVVLFDLDGTLVHSVPDLRVALNRLLAEDGRPALDDAAVTGMVGKGVRVLLTRAYAATGAPPDDAAGLEALTARFLAFYEQAPAALTRPYDGVEAALDALAAAGCRLGVVTNKPQAATAAVLDGLGLAGRFAVVVGGGATANLKPHPEPVLAALARLDCPPAQAVMVGDSENDAEAARAAGLAVVCVTFGYRHCPAEALGADRLIDHFSALPQALAGLWEERAFSVTKGD